ncbi:MAG: LuxR C-terminal-related transcriptional regulator [Rikenellaceae bacterium]
MAQPRVNILVAEPSLIIRGGVVTALLNLNSLRIDIAEVSDMFRLADEVSHLNPDIVIVNPKYLGIVSPRDFIRTDKPIKFIALHNSAVSSELLGSYDAEISLMDSAESIEQTISKLISSGDSGRVELSQRERDIVKAVAKGLSNKEVADLLSISTHTVTTHRRNIASKLEIHNPAGLTIYAIVNGLIDISEVQ